MEYAMQICKEPCNDQYIKHVGYVETRPMAKYYSKQNIDRISAKISQLLQGVDPQNRKIVVPNKTICSIMSSVYSNFRPETGGIYSRYTIPTNGDPGYVQKMTDQVINIITTDVKNNLGMEEANSKLSIWTTVLGDFNPHQLRSHAPIKIREKRPQPMMFFSNY
jgi:hypothetical protein